MKKEVKYDPESEQMVATICVDQAPGVPCKMDFYALTNKFFCWVTPLIADKSINIYSLQEGRTRPSFDTS